jgi:hypothetical protein
VRRAKFSRSIPGTWVTPYSGDMGNSFGPKGLLIGSNAGLVVEIPQAVLGPSTPNWSLVLNGVKGSPRDTQPLRPLTPRARRARGSPATSDLA